MSGSSATSKNSLLPSPRRGQDRQKFIRLERGATDQPAVDIRHREQFRRVTRFDTATVEDARRGGDFSIPLADPGADEGVYLLRLLGRRVAPGPNRPHGLVSDHTRSECASPTELEHRIELTSNDLIGAPGLAIGELLADAQDRHQPPGMRGGKLAG